MRRAIHAVLALSSLVATHAHGQPQALPPDELRCKEALADLSSQADPNEFTRHACRALAVWVYDQTGRGASVAPAVPVEAIQPALPEATGTQGSVAEPAAVSSVRPVAETGGSVAIAGTQQGPQLIAALALNPLALLTDEKDVRRLSYRSRIADISVLLPLNLTQDSPSPEPFQFVGVSIRVDGTAIFMGDAVYERAVDKLRQVQGAVAVPLEELTARLKDSETPKQCALAAASGNSTKMEADCGKAISFEAARKVNLAARDALEEVRADADRHSLGIEVQAAHGELAGGADEKDLVFKALIAGSIKRGDGKHYVALRGRGGWVYLGTDLESGGMELGKGHYAQAAGAIEYARLRDLKRASASLGVEWQHFMAGDAHDRTFDYVSLRFGISVPITDGKQIGIGITVPLADDENDPTFTVTGDWSLLFGS